MGKSKASKEPPKLKEEDITEEQEELVQPEEEVVEEAPCEVTTPAIVEPPIELHLANIIIESFEEGLEDPLFTGCRTVKYRGGHTYTGEFVGGKMHGEGEYDWDFGLKYKGDFKDNQITGRGTYIWPDGSIYKGDVENGLRHGKGTFFCANKPSLYSGDWVYGKRTGYGKMSYDKDEFSYYVGDWVNNEKCGKGFRQYPSGSTYDGEWKRDVRHGTGTMDWAGTGESYTGQWDMGIQHGEGTQTWYITTNSQLPQKNEYRGQWVRGKREGQGEFSYASGARYEGEWIANQKHGYGKFIFKDGSVFSGNFANDSIVGRPGSPDMGKAMRSAVVSGRLSSPIQSVAKTSQSSFHLDITPLLVDEADEEEELKQVHNVLLRHITLLRKIYDGYCKLQNPDSGVLLRMELWKLLKDSGIYLNLTMPDADNIISNALRIECEVERCSPFTQLLFREFLQVLVYLATTMYCESLPRENGIFISKCLSSFLQDHFVSLDMEQSHEFSHSNPANHQYVERCWKIYENLKKRVKRDFTLRDILMILKDTKLIGGPSPNLSVAEIIQDVLMVTNRNIDNEGALYLDIHINFYDFFNVLCGCAGVLRHSGGAETSNYNMQSNIGTETDISNGGAQTGMALSPEKTPLPPGSESPTKSLSKKNTPSETPLQSPVPSEAESDNNEALTPTVESLATEREQSFAISPSIDERCGSFESWDSRIQDFFLCHFFPAAERLLEVEARIAAEKEAERETLEKEAEAKRLETPLPDIQLKSPSVTDNPDHVTAPSAAAAAEDVVGETPAATDPSPAATISVNA